MKYLSTRPVRPRMQRSGRRSDSVREAHVALLVLQFLDLNVPYLRQVHDMRAATGALLASHLHVPHTILVLHDHLATRSHKTVDVSLDLGYNGLLVPGLLGVDLPGGIVEHVLNVGPIRKVVALARDPLEAHSRDCGVQEVAGRVHPGRHAPPLGIDAARDACSAGSNCPGIGLGRLDRAVMEHRPILLPRGDHGDWQIR
mmetsp:Transcript_60080/g.132096  ORF Transcript_60080/g.132096 Transcript_60080/m.132096 type:complete len:200 (+) Transcript_60080:31-630(+)